MRNTSLEARHDSLELVGCPPDQLQYLVENPDKIEGAIEEVLRFNTAFGR